MRVRIREDFTGFPDGTDASKTHYRAGQTLDLDEDFARLVVEKGHAVIDPTEIASNETGESARSVNLEGGSRR